MDRFIVTTLVPIGIGIMALKSNMDRFIGFKHFGFYFFCHPLKSNMDRFIA